MKNVSLPVKIRVGLDVFVVVVFAVAFQSSLEWQLRAGIMPLTVSGLGVVLGIANLVVDLRRWRKVGFAFVSVDKGRTSDVPETKDEATAREALRVRKGIRYFGWILLFSVLTYVAGAMVGATAFLVGFLKLEGGYSWRYILLAVVGTVAAIWAAESLLSLQLPDNILDL